MSTGPTPGDEGEPATPHTEEHITADTEIGDRDPEIEVQEPPRRHSLEQASERVEHEEEAEG